LVYGKQASSWAELVTGYFLGGFSRVFGLMEWSVFKEAMGWTEKILS
jgi:hypothetical protein